MGFVNGKTYRFINKYYSNHALNVFGTNAASTGRNVCLFKDDDTDIMQDWVVKTSGSGYRMHSAVNQSFVLDCSDGSMSSSYKNNAHLCATSQTSTKDSQVEFKKVSDNVYKIYLPGKGLYLTATNTKLVNNLPASSIGNADALAGGTGGQSNVYWASNSTSIKQQWIVSPEVDGGGTTPDPEPGEAQYLALPINHCTITAMYQEDSNPAYQHEWSNRGHFGLDMIGYPNTFYASGNGTVVGVGGAIRTGVGYWVAIRYDNVYSWNMNNNKLDIIPSIIVRYFHLASNSSLKVGQNVNLNTAIGTYGHTGQWYDSMGAHLHVEVDKDVDNPLYTPTLAGSAGGLHAGSDTTFDPCSVFFIKDSDPENQTLTYSQDKCDKHPNANEYYINVAKMNKFMKQIRP